MFFIIFIKKTFVKPLYQKKKNALFKSFHKKVTNPVLSNIEEEEEENSKKKKKY